jgi:hypothetical protein
MFEAEKITKIPEEGLFEVEVWTQYFRSERYHILPGPLLVNLPMRFVLTLLPVPHSPMCDIKSTNCLTITAFDYACGDSICYSRN